MSSQTSSISGGSTAGSVVIRQDVFRSYKSKDHQVGMVERINAKGDVVAIYNHHARGYDKDAPSPSYGRTSGKKSK
ncbi:hypothetical protein GGS21DRAFT_488420 [Xylaria nigripes]|nr:hypothetical protein GGS21DRAFT_488420 [Xylaria nigripes]